MYDLPSEDPEEPGLPDEYHEFQPPMLRQTFQPSNYDPEEVFVGADLNLYYDWHHPNWYKRPDWFAVVGVSRLYEGRDLRMSYVMWQEQVSPFVVVELLSPGTEDEDLGRTSQIGKPPTKWQVYEQILRVPYYFVFSRYTNEVQAFHLVGGHYESMTPESDRFSVPELGLSLGLWEGSYERINRVWLRWFTQSGEMILTPEENAVAQAKAAQAKAELLAAKLRELGIDPDQLS
ncbi:Uma2 family endonuclease [Cyanobacteria bacterium FACHB-472]|nr:Uma2 family endonuclease [Cyanobacteria bacterium FACHB-472]